MPLYKNYHVDGLQLKHLPAFANNKFVHCKGTTSIKDSNTKNKLVAKGIIELQFIHQKGMKEKGNTKINKWSQWSYKRRRRTNRKLYGQVKKK